ncbi:uncharacterized protein AMSG_04698 [Thecamonas trahens ATCC 50062]|uniref:ADF-H domain-containing protein n=1 Tax=Thecamonas trahens ATCC 50062 TaxID=461836 RepID=A0A0L0DCB7_THETB|nr:hypothetical protein AMSG_04698 [Thecamonas trahens ATCC 50062]KNC48953.1 hypothetical protein AMSG_04698 [Thecamonas trahens ATCC 50062]|eukprot:XP_013758370.1 hypothetical protein AMSG_04698 [Thecamonas trahens ATCC 50062]
MAVDAATAWDEVCDQANDRNWVIVNTDLEVVSTGNGGLEEMKAAFDDSEVQFAGFVVYGIDDRGSTVSKRTKTVFCVWIGSGVGALARGRALRCKDEAANLFNGHNLSIDVDDTDDLTQKAIADRLLKAGGAHKPTAYDFGPEQVMEL